MPSVWLTVYKGTRRRSYKVHWREGGVHRSASFPTRAMADEFSARKRSELAGLPYGLTIPSTETFIQAAERYIKECAGWKARNTVEHFDRPALADLARRVGHVDVGRVTAPMIESWREDLESRYGPHTVRMKLRAARAFFHWAKVPANPCRGIKFPHAAPVGRVLSNNEIKALLAAMPDGPRRAATFSLYTGVRLGELVALRWEDIGPHGARVRAKKTHTERVVPLHPRAREALGPPQAAGPAFPMTVNTLQWGIRAARAKAGLGRVRWHDFRHTWATRMMEQTNDFFAVQRLGGWASVASMGVYQHLTQVKGNAILSLDFAHAGHTNA